MRHQKSRNHRFGAPYGSTLFCHICWCCRLTFLFSVPIEAPDGYALGLLLHAVFNRNAPLPPTSQPPHPPPAASSRGSIPTSLWPSFKRLLNPSAKARMTPKAFLQLGMGEKAGDGARFFADNHLVQVCAGLDQFAIGSDAEKAALIRCVLSRILSPDLPQITAHQIIEGLSCLLSTRICL
jgi:SCY1-like protein 1